MEYLDDVVADELLSVIVRCYNKDNTITKSIPLREKYFSKGTNDGIVGQGYYVEIKNIYELVGFHHCLRDEFYKIEVEIINNNDSTTVTRSVLPKDKSWTSYTPLYESLSVGSYEITLAIKYLNPFGFDRFMITIDNYYDQ